MLRRVVIGFAVVLLLAAAGLGLLLVERRAALQALIENRLGALDLSDVKVAVREVAWTRTVLTDIAAGDGASIRRVSVSYALGDLLDLHPPRVEFIEIDGLYLDVGALDEGPLGRLRARLSGGASESDAPPALPVPIGQIRLRDAVVELPTPWGDATLNIDGTAGPVDPDAIPIDASIEATSSFGLLSAEIRGTVALTGDADGEITLASDRFVMDNLTAVGVAGQVDAAITRNRLPTLDGALSIQALDLGDMRIGAARLDARFEGGAGTADLTVSAPHHRAQLRLSAEKTDDPAAPRLTIGLDTEMSAASGILSLAGPWAPRAGRATLSVVAGGEADLGAALPTKLAEIVRRLAAGSWRASVAADLSEIAHDDWAAGLSATAGIDVAAVDDVVTLTLPAPIFVDVAEVDAAVLQRAGLPSELARQFAGPLTANIGARHADDVQARIAFADDSASFSAVTSVWSEGKAPVSMSSALDGTFSLRPSPRLERLAFDRFDVELRHLSVAGQRLSRVQLSANGTAADDRLTATGLVSLAVPLLSLGDISASDIAVELPLDIAVTSAEALVRPTGAANVRFRDLAMADTFDVRQRVTLTLSPRGESAVIVPFDGAGRPRMPHDLVLTSNDLDIRLAVGDDRQTLRLAPLTAEVTGIVQDGVGHKGRVRVSAPNLEIPEHGLAAREIAVDIRTGPRIDTTFTVANVSHPLAPPLALGGEAALENDVVTFVLRPRTADTQIEAEISGRHELAAGRGGARMAVPTIVFSPEGLQPSALSKALSDLTKVSGAVDAAATLDWNRDGIDGTAEIRATDVSFVVADVEIAGLSTALNFRRLLPPVSLPRQPLTIRSIDAGVPLRDLTARLGFALDDDGAARLDLPEATVEFAGGRISLADAALDTGAAENRLALQFDQVDLGELLKLVKLEGLSGTGVLNGSLPVVLRDDRIAVVDGALVTAGSGVLRYRSPTARQALESGGESVDLLLQALENFQYDKLSLAVDKTLDGETEIKLQTTGKNPDVLDGYPFAININLTGNADQILASVLEGFRLSDRALRAIVR